MAKSLTKSESKCFELALTLSQEGLTMLPDQIRKAEVAMMKVALRAMERGAMVSKPVAEGARYDYVIEDQGRLYRVQVKYADGKTTKTTGVAYANLRKQ